MKSGEGVLNRTPQTIEAAKTGHERKLKAAFESLQGGSRDPDGGTRLGVSSRTPGRVRFATPPHASGLVHKNSNTIGLAAIAR